MSLFLCIIGQKFKVSLLETYVTLEDMAYNGYFSCCFGDMHGRVTVCNQVVRGTFCFAISLVFLVVII